MDPRNATTAVHYSPHDFVWYCITCDEELDLSAREAHLTSNMHARRMHGQRAPVVKQEEPKLNTNTEPPPPPPVSMTWICTVCDKEVNIFARTDHLRSKPHIKQLRKHQNQRTTEQTVPESWMWTCTVCEQTMHIFYRGGHLAGRPHAKNLHSKGLNSGLPTGTVPMSEPTVDVVLPSSPPSTESLAPPTTTLPPPPPAIPIETPAPPSPENMLELQSPTTNIPTSTGTYYCDICNSNYSPPFQQLHHSGIWECTICMERAHIDWQDEHLARHRDSQTLPEPLLEPTQTSGQRYDNRLLQIDIEPEVPEGVIYCRVCEREVEKAVEQLHRSRGWECVVCEVKTHADWIGAHIGGAEHQERMRVETLAKSVVVQTSVVRNRGLEVEDEQKVRDRQEEEGEMEAVATEGAGVQIYEICEICGGKIRVAKQGSWRHSTPGWECKICEKMLHVSDKRSHIAGAKHKRRLREKEIQAHREEKTLIQTYRGHEETSTMIPAAPIHSLLDNPLPAIEPREMKIGVGGDLPTYSGYGTSTPTISPGFTTPRNLRMEPGMFYCNICNKGIKGPRSRHEYTPRHVWKKEALERMQGSKVEQSFMGAPEYQNPEVVSHGTPAAPSTVDAASDIAAPPATEVPNYHLPTAESRGAGVGSLGEEGNVSPIGPLYIEHDNPAPTTLVATRVPQKRSEKPGRSYCEICYVNFKPTPVSIARHQQPIWECYVCMKMIYHTKKETHEAGSQHIWNQGLQARRTNGNIAAPTREVLPVAPDSDTMRSRFSPTTARETTQHDPATFYCEICEKDIKTTKVNVVRIHKTRAWECTLCEITTHIAWRRSHSEGSKHQRNLEIQAMAVPVVEEGNGLW